MPKKPQGLQQKGNAYYLRVRIPADLKKALKKSERVISLDTSDYQWACKKIHGIRAELEKEWETLRHNIEAANQNADMLSSYTDAQLQRLATRWLAGTRKRHEELMLKTIADPDDVPLTNEEIIQQLEIDAWQGNQEILGQGGDMHDGMTQAALFLDRQWITYDRKSETFRKLGHYFSKAGYEITMEALKKWKGKTHIPTDQMFMQGNLAVAHLGVGVSKKITVSDLIEEYMADPSKHRGKSTQKNYTIIFRALKELIGADRPVSDITRDECKKIRDLLRTLPSNAAKRAKGKSLLQAAELAQKNGWPLISAGTINGYLDKLNALFAYAEEEDYILKNPAKKLNVKDSVKKKEKRKPFDTAQLNKIFSAPIYTGCVNDESGYAKPGDKRPRRAKFWVPLIALFTGMRLNEICQLEINDIDLVEGVHIFRIHQEGDLEDKKVKTEASIRIIPVHPELVKIGFLNFVSGMKEKGESRLFPEVDTGALGYYSDNFTKWYARFLKKAGASKPRTSFHSFRHTYRDAVREAGLPHDATLQLGGWTTGGTEEIYGAGLKASTLSKHMRKIKYPDLDFSHLYQ